MHDEKHKGCFEVGSPVAVFKVLQIRCNATEAAANHRSGFDLDSTRLLWMLAMNVSHECIIRPGYSTAILRAKPIFPLAIRGIAGTGPKKHCSHRPQYENKYL